jgi:hypothetical protein
MTIAAVAHARMIRRRRERAGFGARVVDSMHRSWCTRAIHGRE